MESRLLPDYKKGISISYPTFRSKSQEVMEQEVNFISSVVKVLENKVPEKTPIVILVRGMSMAILGGSLAYHLRCKGRLVNIVILRKKEDRSHDFGVYTENDPYCLEPSHCYVLIDDIIASGKTVLSVPKVIRFTHKKRKIDFLFVSEFDSFFVRQNLESISKYYKYLYSNYKLK